MAIPVATALGRRDRLWPAVAISMAVHAALGVAAVARRQPAIDLNQKPIVAKLVRLGPKKPEEYLPRKEAAPPPAPAAPVAAPPAPVAAAPAPTPKPAPVTAKQAAPAPKAAAAAGGNRLSSVLNRMQKEVAQSQWGDPNGDPMGDSEEGSEGDRYLALATRALQSNYRLPATISEKDRLYLKAVVVLYVDADGRISSWKFEKRSGNEAYDDALDRAIRQTRLPPPPPDMRARFRTAGLGVNFKI